MKIDIIWLASLIGAFITIGGTAWKLHVFLNKLEDKFDSYDDTMTENTIHILRMSLLCEDLPVVDRIQAGKKYLELGGNGYGHIVYNQLIENVKKHPRETIHSTPMEFHDSRYD